MSTRTPPSPSNRALTWSLLALLPTACVDGGDADPGTDGDVATTTASSSASPQSDTSEGSPEDSTTAGATSAAQTSAESIDPATGGGETEAETSAETSAGSSAESSSESGSACGDVENDPLNCGECDVVCAAPSNAEATCDDGMCGLDCDPGYDEVDVGGDTRCSKFAGFFLRRETGTCEAENPFTGDCTCPAGFDDRPVTSWRIDPTDGSSWVQLAACSPVAEDPTDAWGGMFAEYEGTGSCAFPNPLNIPLCVCPAGYSVTSQWRGANINGDAIRISFCTEDAFEDDALFVGGFTETSGGGCATSDCSCPAGATAVEYPTVFAGSTTSSTFCYRP